MRLERPEVHRGGGLAQRSISLAWIGGEARMTVEVPAEYAPPDSDCSPFVPVALLASMRRAEPLQIDGSVSARLMANLAHAQEIIAAWNPTMRRVRVRAAALEDPPLAPVATRACCFSRGIDSTYSAAVDRPAGEEIGCLVHWRDFQLVYGERTQSREVELVREAAGRLDRPVVVVSSDVPKVLHGLVDFTDATSAMLASVGLSLPGLAGRVVMPSTLGYADLAPMGTHPLLDGLWSTDAVTLEHDSCVPSRDDKVEWLVQNRPDLLELIHVCMDEDSVENCGRCTKCVWTMVLLRIYGGLERSSFPDRIDPERVRRLPRQALHRLTAWERIHERLGDSSEDAALKRAIRHGLRISVRKPAPRESLGMTGQRARRMHQLLHGNMPDIPAAPRGVACAEVAPADPSWPPPRDERAGLLGLVRAVDYDARLHRYAAGALPAGQRSGELGALLAEPPEDGLPLVLGADGRPALERLAAGRPRWARARWVLEPLVWGVQAAPVARLRSVARRAVDAARRRDRDARPAGVAPVGWLHATAGSDRAELWAAAHPVLDDVLLTTDRDEPDDLGYCAPVLLGFVERRAPVTGTVGAAELPIPWVRRWGRRR